MPTTFLGQMHTLLGAKALACGRTYKGLIPEGDLDSPETRSKFPAEVRASKATKDYYKVARYREPQAPSKRDCASTASPTNMRTTALCLAPSGSFQRSAAAPPTPSPE